MIYVRINKQRGKNVRASVRARYRAIIRKAQNIRRHNNQERVLKQWMSPAARLRRQEAAKWLRKHPSKAGAARQRLREALLAPRPEL